MPAGLGVWELVIIFAVLLLLFGARRLPEMGRSLGRGMREFKDAVTGKDDEPDRPGELTTTAPAPGAHAAPTVTHPSSTNPSETERVSS
ncbi:MAG: twin-arginine translocase TatA/TatE family subunit [Actinomycetota bacterium]|jgi:sec-independent protein translocase protein TatA|nr:twin-arginine translocase TatA/TatE family subunit [Actinomycetota bacterium]